MNQIKSNLSLYSLYYAEACNELAGPISASLRPGNTAPFEEMSQRWRAVGNTVSDLTGLRFEPQTSRSRDERVTARPTGPKYKIIVQCDFDEATDYKHIELCKLGLAGLCVLQSNFTQPRSKMQFWPASKIYVGIC